MALSKTKIGLVVIGLLLVSNFFLWQAVLYLSNPYSSVIFFDVGQGDASFIQTSKKHQILIDGGPNSSILEKISSEIPFYDRTLDLVILTHPEKDHLAGLLEVLKRYKIKNILWTGVVRDTLEWQEWEKLIASQNTNVKTVFAGERIILQEDPDISIDILNPKEGFDEKEVEDSNFTSIVLRLLIGERSFLFCGDIDSKTEKEIEISNSDILKVAHHGSKYSSSEGFLKTVLPKVAVIEVGKNSYGHPSEDVLARLNNFGIEILRTDKQGDIEFISDGKSLKITNNKKL